MTINNKYTAEEKEMLVKAIRFNAFVDNRMGTCTTPQTEEEFEKWCDNYLEEQREEERKQAERKAKAQERMAQAGYKTKQNWKRKGTEIAKLEKEIREMQRKIAYLEKARKELAKQYKEEVGEEIK